MYVGTLYLEVVYFLLYRMKLCMSFACGLCDVS